jgi:two-component system, chemotaxis family, protein-glutamate methylesterase/glutaminase
MSKPRVLIVDDSVVIRRSLADSLSCDPRVEVVGSAPTGRVAMMKIALVRPDIVALDIEMPNMSGLETLAAIRQAYPQLPVIMLGVPTDQGAAAILDALTLGARDYVTKPLNAASSNDSLRLLGMELISKIQGCFPHASQDVPVASSRGPVSTAKPLLAETGGSSAKRVDVLAIGASTGGPNALMELIPALPADFPVPILIVQHMPAMFTKLLAQRLATKCKVSVAEGSSRQRLLPGTAWIAPGDLHMAIAKEGDDVRIVTHRDPPENSCRPAADVLFRSVAQVYGSHVLAVVMTGMGRDGLRGCEQIHAAGGQVLVQDEASSIVWGMPSFVVKAGIADRILPLKELGAEILSRAWRYRSEKHALVTG